MAADRAALRLHQARLSQQNPGKTAQVSSAKLARQAAEKTAGPKTAKPVNSTPASPAAPAGTVSQPRAESAITHRLQVQEEAPAMAKAVKKPAAAPPTKTNWKRAILLSEILSPPVSKRGR